MTKKDTNACDYSGCDHNGSLETCGLNRLGVGCQGAVVAVGGDAELKRRLLEMGFCNGAKVEVLRRAPFGDPTEFRLRGYCLSLREEQAKYVQIAVQSRPV
jgi:Fe2+ transport system protein FeoA